MYEHQECNKGAPKKVTTLKNRKFNIDEEPTSRFQFVLFDQMC